MAPLYFNFTLFLYGIQDIFSEFWTFFYFIFIRGIDNKGFMDYTLLYNNTINGKKNAS